MSSDPTSVGLPPATAGGSGYDFSDAIRLNAAKQRGTYYPHGRVGQEPRRHVRFKGRTIGEVRADLEADIIERLRVEGTDIDLFALMQQWSDNHRSVGANDETRAKYVSAFNNHIPESVQDKACGELTRADLTNVFDALNKKGASEGVIKQVRNTLGTLVSFARRSDRDVGQWSEPHILRQAQTDALKNTRAQGKLKPQAPIGLSECPRRGEVVKYADALETQWPGYGGRAVLLAYATGMRPSELLALRVEHVVFDGDDVVRIRVEGQMGRRSKKGETAVTKSCKHRETIVWECYRWLIEDLVAEATTRDGKFRDVLLPLDDHDPAMLFDAMRRKAKDVAGITWTFRWLRHSFATVSMAPAASGGYGYDDAKVSKWLGHHSVAFTLKFYRKQAPDNVSDRDRSVVLPPD